MNQSVELSQSAMMAAEAKQAMLAAIIESTDDIIISKTTKGIITSWNPAAERMFGYTEEEAVGQHISLIIPEDRLDKETYIIGQIIGGRKVDHFETFRRHKNGTLVPLSITVSPIKGPSGEIIGASKIARDITDRREAAKKERILAAIVDTSDDTILSKTLDGMITSWNKAAVKMFGYTEAEAIGKHISLIIPADRIGEEEFIIGEVKKGNKVDHFQTLRRTKHGKLIPISVSVSPITDENGVVIGASKIARDISVEQAAQQEMAQLYLQLQELNARKDEFIGLASHELKTPLASINGYLQILNKRVADQKDKQFVEKAQHQLNKLSALVNELLDISKIEAGKLHFAYEEFDIIEVLRDAIDLIAHVNEGYQIKLHSDIHNYLIMGDAHRIEQVVINLLTNAIRYSPGTDQIEVFFERAAGEIKIGVKDYGIGIAPDKLNQIFSRYYRVDDQNAKISGLGIGLYLCYEIVTRHRGHIWAESELGKGSTFWFALPFDR